MTLAFTPGFQRLQKRKPAGDVWFLQCIKIIPGSFMTGQTRWAIYGAVTVIVGLALVFGVPKRRNNT